MTTPDRSGPDRRQVAIMATAAGAAITLASPRSGLADTGSSRPMMMTCVIRYQIDPFQKADFRRYAQAWETIIPRCGGYLIGYFLPWEGTNDIAWGLISLESLAAYEAYRKRLQADPEAQANLAMARTKRLILREERNFVENVSGTICVPAQRPGP